MTTGSLFYQLSLSLIRVSFPVTLTSISRTPITPCLQFTRGETIPTRRFGWSMLTREVEIWIRKVFIAALFAVEAYRVYASVLASRL